MSEPCRVVWQHKTSKMMGKSGRTYPDHAAAMVVAEELNTDYPHIIHRVVTEEHLKINQLHSIFESNGKG